MAKKMLATLLCACLLLMAFVVPVAAEGTDKQFAPYENPVTITVGRTVASNVKFEPNNPDRASIESNLWTRTYKEKLNIDVQYLFTTPSAEETNAKWFTSIASGDIPDFGAVSETVYLSLLEGGLVADMTEIFPEYASDYILSLLDRGNHVAEEYITFDGRMMGIPVTSLAASDTYSLFIRPDWLEKVGKEVPKTMDELVDVAKAFVEANLGGEGTVGLPASEEFGSGDGSLHTFMNGYGAFYDMWIDDGAGNLVYSTVQEPMKAALLKLQDLYKTGIINADFAVCTTEATRAYTAAGKAGMFFGSYASMQGIKASLELDADAVWSIEHVPGVDGKLATLQCSANPSFYFFVSALCKNPEAIVKMQNLECELLVGDYYTYSTTKEDKFEYFQYTATGQHQAIPRQNVLRQQEATAAYTTGNKVFTSPLAEISYTRLLDAEGVHTDTNPFLWGPVSTFQIIYETMKDGRNLLDAYQTQQTETMALKKSMLKTALDAAMQKVIMGEDISVFEKAVEEWYAQGGQAMTDEANAWYKAR